VQVYHYGYKRSCLRQTRAVLEKRQKGGYEQVVTRISKKELYVTSGHYIGMLIVFFQPIPAEGEEFLLKPMNCPHHC
jgi:threonyl-tRNA synthetase